MIRYRSFFLPVGLIAIGIIALLGNFNLVPWDSLYRLLDLWPLVLIVFGLEIIIRRTLPPPAGPALAMAVFAGAVVVALLYVAAAPAVNLSPVSTSSSAPVGSVQKATLDLQLGAATVKVKSADLGADLYQATFRYPQGDQPRVEVSSGTLRISDRGSFHRNFFGIRDSDRRAIDLTINSSLPWTIHLAGGAVNEQLDLSGTQLSKLTLDGGASQVDATLPRPSGTVTVEVSGGAEKLLLHRPSGVAVSVHMSGGANTVQVDDHRQAQVGGETGFSTPGYDAATDRYEISVNGGASSVVVDTSS